MSNYKVIYTQIHRVDLIASEEFDITSEEQWNNLKERVKDCGLMEEEDFNELPDQPPSDINVWLNLYKNISQVEFGNLQEDWVSDRKGGYEVTYAITDDNGNVVLEE